MNSYQNAIIFFQENARENVTGKSPTLLQPHCVAVPTCICVQGISGYWASHNSMNWPLVICRKNTAIRHGILVAITGTSTMVTCHVVKSRQLIWRLGTRRWNLRVPDLQTGCRDLTTWWGSRIVAPAMAICPTALRWMSQNLIGDHYTPLNKVEGGYTGFTMSICPSICGQNRGHSVSSTILTESISYLHILSSNFRRCVVCKVFIKIKKFEVLANSLNL